MGYTVPSTVATDDILTATIWNASVKDDVIFLANPPMVSAYRSAALSISDSTWTAVTLQGGEDFDTDSIHSTSTNTSRFTIVTAGKYSFDAYASLAANSSGRRSLRFIVDNTTSYVVSVIPSVTGSSTVVNGSLTLSLTAGQYVEMQVLQTSGGALDCESARMQARMVSQ